MAELFDQITATTDPVQRRDLTDSLIAELVRHSVAEEMHVYPAIRDHVPDGAAAVDDETQEHEQLEVSMKELESADASSCTTSPTRRVSSSRSCERTSPPSA